MMVFSPSANLIAVVLAISVALPANAQAPTPNNSMEADTLSFDDGQSTIKANGNVKIEKNGQTLVADKVIWKQADDEMNAEGNVILREPDGTLTEAQSMVLDNQLSEGEIYTFRRTMSNQAHLQADSALQSDEGLLLQNAGYTACPECEEPTADPLWQLRAREIDYDKAKEDVIYRHMWLEVAGTPVFYLPYFTHPGPKVERRSGFLSPRIESNKAFGFGFETPYYFDLAPNYDLTLTPRVSEKQNPYLVGHWRHLIGAGSYDITTYAHQSDDPLLTSDPSEDLNVGIEAKGNFLLGQWQTQLVVKDANDDLFFRRYKIDNDDQMESKAISTRFTDNGYIRIAAHKYRSVLNNQTDRTVNDILPSITHQQNFENPIAGGQLTMTNQLSHNRRALGLDITAAKSSFEWTREFAPRYGVVWEVQNLLQFDAYHYDDKDSDPIQSDDAPHTLAANSVSLKASYPMEKLADSHTQTLTPQAQLVLATDNERYQDVPYISAPVLDLTRASLFQLAAPNDEASRVNLGVSHGLLHTRGIETDLFIGQSFNISDSDYTLASGYGDGSSAYVVQGNLAYQSAVSKIALTQNLRIDPSDNATLRNQVNASYQRAGFSTSVDYSFFADGQTATGAKKEQTVTMNWQMSDYWQVEALNRRDLRNDRDVLSSLDFVYEDICTLVRVSFSRDYAEIDNIEPETSIGITFVLKTLGGTE